MRKSLLGITLFTGIFLVIHLLSQNNSSFPNIPNNDFSRYDTSIKIGDTKVTVEVVNTNESRSKGLSGRKSLCNNCGMLFDFGYENHTTSFWMKDMLIPIDIIWINDGKVVGIEKNAQPEPDKSDKELAKYSPPSPIDYVLEVNSGFSDKQLVEVGQSVKFP